VGNFERLGDIGSIGSRGIGSIGKKVIGSDG